MRLGVSYNLFDGEELLEGSIKQIRNLVDYISVVYQNKSYYGNLGNPLIQSFLEDLKSKKVIDEYVEYTCESITPQRNELNKRNLGLELSKKNGCTHHMSMDCDEYYVTKEFNSLKNIILQNDYDSSYCKMINYYKSFEYVLSQQNDFCVSLIFKINENSKFEWMSKSPVELDPTRNLENICNPLILDRSQMQMHHGGFVRKNIEMKLRNSSIRNLFQDKINTVVNYYYNWSFPMKAMWSYGNLQDVEKVKNPFN